MNQITCQTKPLRRLANGSRSAIAGLWPAARVERTIVPRWVVLAAAQYPDDDEHDGWQPIRLRRRPLRIISIADERRLKQES